MASIGVRRSFGVSRSHDRGDIANQLALVVVAPGSIPPTRAARGRPALTAWAPLAGFQLRDGHSLRLESNPGDASVRKSLADAFYRIGGQDVRHGSAARS